MKFASLTTTQEIQDLIRWHNEHSEFIILDLETTGLNSFRDHIVNIVLSGYSPDQAFLLAPHHLSLLSEINRPILAHNFKFDFCFAYRAGIDLRHCGLFADTLLLDHLLDENQEHSLDSIIKRRYNDPYKEIFWTKYKNYEDASEADRLEYACKDVIYTGRVYRDLAHELTACGIPDSLISHVHRLALTLYDTELNGVALDLPYLESMSEKLVFEISGLKHKMRSLTDLDCQILENAEFLKLLESKKTEKGKQNVKRPEFNFDSTKQLGSLLYDKLNLPLPLKHTKRTVDDAALEALETKHAIIPYLREYRGSQKLFTSFIEGSLQKMQGGRIYPTFNVNGTVTGRISSSQPNMQQLPKEGGIRGIYIPDSGCVFISCDYAQLEVSLAAHFSRDENLLKIVYEGASQHDITARGLGIDRTLAKTINFAMQYGAGIQKIRQILGCGQQNAEDALKKYWETYAGLARFISECHAYLERGKPLINPFGRRRRFNILKVSFWQKERAKRQAANSLIQGTGADITSRALYLVNDILVSKKMGKALFSIHDEILIMVKSEHADEASEILKNTMIGVGKEINLSIPLSVDCSKPMLRWEKS